MYYINSNNQKYSSSGNQPGLISMSQTKDWCHGYYDWILMYGGRVTKYVIAKMSLLVHLHLHSFVNYSAINVGSLIYLFDDRVITWIAQVFFNN